MSTTPTPYSLPDGFSESEVLEAIENAVRILAPSFTFGIYDLPDIQQEARMEGWRVLPRYDPCPNKQGKPTRPLANYMYKCIKNRLIRLKRDKFRRTEPSCKICHGAEKGRTGHSDGEYCKKYLAWRKRNDAKANLMRPMGIDHVQDEKEENTRADSRVAEEAGSRELLRQLDERLPVELREYYLLMLAGRKVPKGKKLAIQGLIKEILKDDNQSE